jgi:hypothetical protein
MSLVMTSLPPAKASLSPARAGQALFSGMNSHIRSWFVKADKNLLVNEHIISEFFQFLSRQIILNR